MNIPFSPEQILTGFLGLGLLAKGVLDHAQKPPAAPPTISKEWASLEFQKLHMKLDALLRECRKD